jgi:DNA-binding NtrC family response regulator
LAKKKRQDLKMVQEKILILEEDLQLQWILKTYLETKGFNIIAHDTIEKVKESISKEKVSVFITTEYWINHSHTLEMIKQLKITLPQVYIMLITYRMMDEKEYEDFLVAGVDDLLEKPFSLGKIPALLHKRLGTDFFLQNSKPNESRENRPII